MTYIVANKSKDTQKRQLKDLLENIFGKEVKESPDVHVLNPAEENSIGIDAVKEFQKSMRFMPFEEEVQVGIILQAEKLTDQAQNTLLKTLEDSSSTSIFILCVDNEKNLLPTIRSRGIILYSKHKIEKSETKENALKDFLQLDILEQFNLVEEYSKKKTSSLLLIDALEDIFRDRLELDIKNGNIDSSQKNLSFLKTVQKSREKISANCNRRLTLEALIVQLNA